MSIWANTSRYHFRALLLGTALALLLVCMFAAPVFAADWEVSGGAGCSDATGSPYYCHIQAAIDSASPGDTIKVRPGTYAENLLITKHVKLVGAGSGTDAATNTVLQPPSGNVVTITGSGESDSNPLLLKSLRITPQGTVGINLGNTDLSAAETVSYLRLEDVQVVGSLNQANGEHERCLNLDLNKSVVHLSVVNSGFSQCDYGWYFGKQNGTTFTPNTAQYVTVSNSSFADNSYKGLYVEMLSDATFDSVAVTNNGQIANWSDRWNTGFEINLKGDTTGQARIYQNLVFRNMTMTGNGLGARDGAALVIKVRDDGSCAPYQAVLSNVLVDSGLFTGNERGIRVGEPDKNNAGPFNVQIHNTTIYGNKKTYTGTDGTLYGGVINYSRSVVDATNNWWGAANGPSGDGTGSGDAVRHVSAAVLFNPYLTALPKVALIIPGTPVDLALGATSFTLPVNLNATAGSLSSTAFSLDYDTACLSINPSDSNGDGIPEAISGLPGGFVNSVMLDTADTDGELDVAMWDVTPPLAALPAGSILKIKFDILPACQGPNDHSTFVKFSSAPTPTFSDANGRAVYRATQSADPLLLDYNQPPTAISLNPSSVAENAPAGTTVGTLSVTDPDGDAPTYTLSSACTSGGPFANSDFSLSGSTLKTAGVFDFEATPSKTICVEANDGQGGILAAPLTISILDVNEAPTGIVLNGNTVWEGAAAGTQVGTFSTSGDPEGGQTFSYSLVSGDGAADNSKFTIDGNRLKIAITPDYAAQSVYYIRVRSTDSGVPTQYVEKQFVVSVLDHSLLSIGDTFVVRHNETIGIPVAFVANGNAPTVASFGLTYNATCLTYVSTSGGTGIAGVGVVTVNTTGPFTNGTLVTINFTANLACPSGTSVPLGITAASLAGPNGPLPVETDDGKVLVIANSPRGDCNSDGFVNAGDFSAIVLETFDTDLPWWLDAPQSTFPGSPVGCDANASKYIDVADVVCTVLVVFGNSSCTGGSLIAAAAAEPAVLAMAPAADGSAIEVPVTLDRKGAAAAAAAFTLTYDPQQAAFDSTDADGDGLPDAVVFATNSALKRSVSVDAASGRIKIAVYGLTLPLPTIDDGLVATVHLQALGDQPLANLGLIDPALGSDTGSNTPVEVAVGGVQVKPFIYLPAVLH
ncbi:MAG: cohesin domain-containing protein [Caldilineaceae bacterium]